MSTVHRASRGTKLSHGQWRELVKALRTMSGMLNLNVTESSNRTMPFSFAATVPGSDWQTLIVSLHIDIELTDITGVYDTRHGKHALFELKGNSPALAQLATLVRTTFGAADTTHYGFAVVLSKKQSKRLGAV